MLRANNGYIVIIKNVAVNDSTQSEAGLPAPGTPQWWSIRPARPTERGRGRPPRSFDRIIATASALVDEVGMNAFSMRLLAERLGTSTATLYRHVASKEELMVYVVDRVFADVAAAAEPRDEVVGSWQDAAVRASLEFRRVLSDHPNLLPLLVSQVPIGPNGLTVRERTIATLVRHGFSPSFAARAYTTLAHYVIGFAIQEQAPGAPTAEDGAALGDYYRALDPDTYPCTVAAADALTVMPLEDEFVEGLRFILDGIDRARQTNLPER
jgi:AcrR family transcriptional regulator